MPWEGNGNAPPFRQVLVYERVRLGFDWKHYAGDFPLRLSPIQARVLQSVDFCNKAIQKLKKRGIRAEVCHGERLPKLIRNAEKQKTPLMAVFWPKEVETDTVTVRSRFNGELGNMPVDKFASRTNAADKKSSSFSVALPYHRKKRSEKTKTASISSK
ncbi:hypothetical protein MLD38_003019 [Melastoma candidum]|uniref:Uncharacterized protein n=1 Tax=Melastoma candidum TaxID=119954 RepID=A0ACB9S1V5_9MYRT|nr:hypothetical protein MLD38_003019 [Melastoma candidum]